MLTPFDEELNIETRFIDRYQILSVLGRGSMGIVYKGRHELMDRLVAIKMLRGQLELDERSLRRFEREARAASRMDHPNLIAVHDFGLTEKRQPYLIMDYAAGVTLHTLYRRDGVLAPPRAVHIFSQVCDAMHHAHVQGVIHRDLKPSNIMIISKNEDHDFVKVFDLGVAKIAWGNEEDKAAITNTGEVCGSPVYLSPEQCTHSALDPRTDIYSLGVVMYELLTGMPPLLGQTVFDTIYMHVHVKPPTCSEMRPDFQIPERLERIIMKTLEKNPDDRYQSMQELKWELLSALETGEPNLRVLPPEALRNLRKRGPVSTPDEAALERDKATGTVTITPAHIAAQNPGPASKSALQPGEVVGTSRKDSESRRKSGTSAGNMPAAKPSNGSSKNIPLDTSFVDDHSGKDLLRATTDRLRAQFNIEISPFSAAVASSIASIVITAAIVFMINGAMKQPSANTNSSPVPDEATADQQQRQELPGTTDNDGAAVSPRATDSHHQRPISRQGHSPATRAARANANVVPAAKKTEQPPARRTEAKHVAAAPNNGSFFSIFNMGPNATPPAPAHQAPKPVVPQNQTPEYTQQVPQLAPPPNTVPQNSQPEARTYQNNSDAEALERKREAAALNNEAVALINDAPAEAIQKLQSALRINPGYTRAKQNLGHAYLNNANKLLENGDSKGAQRNYRMAISTLQAALGSAHPDTQEAQAAYTEFMNSGR